MSDGYAVYEPRGSEGGGGEPGGAEPPGSTWQVLVEYTNPSTGKPSTIVRILEEVTGTRAEATAAAQQHAFAFDPPDPAFPGDRQVYVDGEGFLTAIKGATRTFHFSTRVVRRLDQPGPAPETIGQPAYSEADRRRDEADGAVV